VRAPTEPGPPSTLALGVLVALAVLAPWRFGAVLPPELLAVTAVSLLSAALALAVGAVRGGVRLPAVPLWPLLGFLALGLAQLVPLPASLHALVAPGSFAVWRPAEPTAAAVLGALAHPVSLDPDATLRSVALVAGLALLAALAAPALARAGTAVSAVAAVTAGGFLLSAYAIFARARFGSLLYGSIAVPTLSPFGPFVNKNHFAGWTAMAALLAAGLALGLAERARGPRRDWTTGPGAAGVVLAIVAALAMALAVLASLSRGGVIALGAGGACLLALFLTAGRGGKGRARLLPSLALAGVLGALLLALVPTEAQERMRSLSGASFRLGTWRDATRMALTSPAVGVGLGAFHDAYPRFKQGTGFVRVEHAENDYLETLTETGFLGLFLALSAGGLLLSGAGRGLGEEGDRTVRGIALGAVAGLAALAVHSAVDFDLRIPSNAALAAVLASAAAGAVGLRARTLGRAPSTLLALAALGLLAGTLRLPVQPWLGAREEARLAVAAGSPEARGLRLERAEAALVGLLRRRPAHAESWLMLAGVRAARGDRASGAALARHAVLLDPERADLRGAAARLEP
jgi:O-antigen ligase